MNGFGIKYRVIDTTDLEQIVRWTVDRIPLGFDLRWDYSGQQALLWIIVPDKPQLIDQFLQQWGAVVELCNN